MTGTRTLVRCITIASALLLATAANALGAGLKTGTGNALIAVNSTGTASAQCPSGNVVSGGYFDPGHDGTAIIGPESLAFSSNRSGSKSWRASGYNDGGATSPWQTFAYCSKDRALKSSKTVLSSVPLPGAGGTAVATAKCPSGYKVLSGGFSALPWGPPTFGVVFRSIKSGNRSWSVGALSNSPGIVTAFAYCRKGGSGLKTRSASTAIPGATGFLGSATAQCKSGERVLSGGFDSLGFVAPSVHSYESQKVGKRSWRASGDNYSGVLGTWAVYAYCEKT